MQTQPASAGRYQGTLPHAPLRYRNGADGSAIIDIDGQITGFAENVLMDAYIQATTRGATSVLLNFAELDCMNSSGIGLLVTLLVRTKRKGQRLAAFGLSDHSREIFQLTRLDEAITIHDDEASALAGAAS